MKISGKIFQDAVNRMKPTQKQQPIKNDGQTESVKADKVSINSEKAPEIKGYSPEDLRSEKPVKSRAENIARIKEAVNNNTYDVSSQKVAEKLVGIHLNELV